MLITILIFLLIFNISIFLADVFIGSTRSNPFIQTFNNPDPKDRLWWKYFKIFCIFLISGLSIVILNNKNRLLKLKFILSYPFKKQTKE